MEPIDLKLEEAQNLLILIQTRIVAVGSLDATLFVHQRFILFLKIHCHLYKYKLVGISMCSIALIKIKVSLDTAYY